MSKKVIRDMTGLVEVSVKSWENDGDFYFTRTRLLSPKKAEELCKTLWKMRGIGNEEIRGHKEFSEGEYDLYDELVGNWCEGEYFRNVDAITQTQYEIADTVSVVRVTTQYTGE